MAIRFGTPSALILRRARRVGARSSSKLEDEPYLQIISIRERVLDQRLGQCKPSARRKRCSRSRASASGIGGLTKPKTRG